MSHKTKYLELKNQLCGILTCQSCQNLITSQEHIDRCITSISALKYFINFC